MEPQQAANPEDTSGKGTFLCRQSSTRWTPTTEQIRILKDLYYNSGVRSPNAEEIQRISARLRQYGKIEGKNVFYWFQNYKARERQKKRFITTDVPMQRPPPPNANAAAWRPDQDPPFRKYQNITSAAGISAPSPSAAMYAVQEMGHYGGYGGSVTMEKSFRDCAISSGSGGSGGVGGSISHNLGWGGIDPYASSCTLFDKKKLDPYASSCTLFDKKKSILDDNIKEEDDEEEEAAPNIETLSLFPMHAEEDRKPNPNSYYTGSWYGPPGSGNGSSWASLELSLNSYDSRPGSM